MDIRSPDPTDVDDITQDCGSHGSQVNDAKNCGEGVDTHCGGSNEGEVASEDGEGNSVATNEEAEDGDTIDGFSEDSYSTASENANGSMVIDTYVDILKIDLADITVDTVGRLDFADMEVAYQFYDRYAKTIGFSVRRGQVIKSKKGEILQQTFLCSRQGYRETLVETGETSKRRPRHNSRCGCDAKFRVHVNCETQRWYVTVFIFDHNHVLLGAAESLLLPGHRKLSSCDLAQIENFRISGITTTQMYGVLANAAGGYNRLGYLKKDIYNQVGRQRQKRASDATGAISYLMSLKKKDPLMYVNHTVDDETRLQHIFWCDGESRLNYEVFGDVVAFDATYKKNKYKCPFVVFSGVNHHNQTTVFATALVSNEREETYVWLLRNFMVAMKQKAPISVITDGCLAMKNAIERVFPNAHQRLCAWHLLRCAVRNIHIPEFLPYFKRCMLGDIEVSLFDGLWADMVANFELQDNDWINDMYEKRRSWATAYIRGQFFAGIRTTSRCEAFHSHIRQFVHPRINLTDFVFQFQRCLTYFRFREVEADFQSNYGQAVLQTDLTSLERSAAKVYTREIFFQFRPILRKGLLYQLIDCQEMTTYKIYSVSKYRDEGTVWQVSCSHEIDEFRCPCLRMESLGVPCEHIMGVVVRLNLLHIPKCLFLSRWMKNAKQSIQVLLVQGADRWDSELVSRYATVSHLSSLVCGWSYRDIDDYNKYVEYLTSELNRLCVKHDNVNPPSSAANNAQVGNRSHRTMPSQSEGQDLQNPLPESGRGVGELVNDGRRIGRRRTVCGACRGTGHNRRRCPILRQGQALRCPSRGQSTLHRQSDCQDATNTGICNDELVDEGAGQSSRPYEYGS